MTAVFYTFFPIETGDISIEPGLVRFFPRCAEIVITTVVNSDGIPVSRSPNDEAPCRLRKRKP